jgi:hypothetical protein
MSCSTGCGAVRDRCAVSSVADGIAVAADFIVYQRVENHFILPRIMTRTIDLSAPTVIGTLLIGRVLGLEGALTALPIGAAVKVVLREVWLVGRMTSATPAGAASSDDALLQRLLLLPPATRRHQKAPSLDRPLHHALGRPNATAPRTAPAHAARWWRPRILVLVTAAVPAGSRAARPGQARPPGRGRGS